MNHLLRPRNWEVIKDVRSHRAKVGTFFATKAGRRSKGEGCSRQRVRRDLHRRNFQGIKSLRDFI
jgi:hypothetical protein